MFFKMRIGMKIKILITVSLIGFSFFQQGNAQKRRTPFEPYSTVSVGLGTSNYYGDLAPYSTPIQSTFYMMRWNVGANYTRHFTPRLAARVGFAWARIASDDETLNRGGKPNSLNYVRNLHFRNDLKEFSLIGIFNLKADGRNGVRRADFMPYLFGGLAIVAHNPKAKTPENFEKRTWVSLQPIGTEGQGQPGYDKPYSLVTLAIPFGFGLKWKINDRFDFGAEAGFRFTFSDYLDDVSTKYADPAVLRNELAQALSNRSLEEISARKLINRKDAVRSILKLDPSADPFTEPIENYDVGDFRGNAQRKDAYLLGIFYLNYTLPGKVKCPPLR